MPQFEINMKKHTEAIKKAVDSNVFLKNYKSHGEDSDGDLFFIYDSFGNVDCREILRITRRYGLIFTIVGNLDLNVKVIIH
ncbi:hypothetical protein GCM10027442_38790 [Emticicia fontis]